MMPRCTVEAGIAEPAETLAATPPEADDKRPAARLCTLANAQRGSRAPANLELSPVFTQTFGPRSLVGRPPSTRVIDLARGETCLVGSKQMSDRRNLLRKAHA